MSDMYFEYKGCDRSVFKGFIQTFELSSEGIITINYNNITMIFTPKIGDSYQCGDSYTWYKVNEKDIRWIRQ